MALTPEEEERHELMALIEELEEGTSIDGTLLFGAEAAAFGRRLIDGACEKQGECAQDLAGGQECRWPPMSDA